ncbi:class I SAM-dependent methyltransferase [Dactylosporangium sp. CS-047395]|uniref:class I SAM-dependent methyltransferase n=1 Tax=Dactylosporangium sp. CS-047395 TaxID=3239936 RepID=UPI003D947357
MLVPEIALDLAPKNVGLFDATGGYRSDTPPPFWSFVWPGGLALARFVLDSPSCVLGKSVVDIGAGSGIVAIAAAMAGARRVVAVDTDPAALAACVRNAAANKVELETARQPEVADVVLAGDVFYSPAVVGPVLQLLRDTAPVALVGDPGRGFLPERLFIEEAAYDVPVRQLLEDRDVMRTKVWRLTSGASGPC